MRNVCRAAVLVFCWTAALGAPAPARAEEPDPSKFLSMARAYLELMDHMGRMASDPRSALLLAQNSIKEVYEQKGQKTEAVQELRRILEGLEDQPARNAVRMAIADIYKETGQKDRALEELRAIVGENKALLARRK